REEEGGKGEAPHGEAPDGEGVRGGAPPHHDPHRRNRQRPDRKAGWGLPYKVLDELRLDLMLTLAGAWRLVRAPPWWHSHPVTTESSRPQPNNPLPPLHSASPTPSAAPV